MDASVGRTLSFMPGETVVRQGDWPHYAYVVQAGRARMVHDVGEKRADIGKLVAGDMFGEMGFFGLTTRTCSVVAEEPLEVGLIDRATLKHALAGVDPDAQQALERMSHVLHHVQDVRVALERCLEESGHLDPAVTCGGTLEKSLSDVPEVPRKFALQVRGRLQDAVHACGSLMRRLEALEPFASSRPASGPRGVA